MTKLIKLDALRWLKHFQNRSTADQAESLNSSSLNSPKLLLRLRFSRKVVFSGFLTSTDFSVPVKIKVGPWPKISRLNFFRAFSRYRSSVKRNRATLCWFANILARTSNGVLGITCHTSFPFSCLASGCQGNQEQNKWLKQPKYGAR